MVGARFHENGVGPSGEGVDGGGCDGCSGGAGYSRGGGDEVYDDFLFVAVGIIVVAVGGGGGNGCDNGRDDGGDACDGSRFGGCDGSVSGRQNGPERQGVTKCLSEEISTRQMWPAATPPRLHYSEAFASY